MEFAGWPQTNPTPGLSHPDSPDQLTHISGAKLRRLKGELTRARRAWT